MSNAKIILFGFALLSVAEPAAAAITVLRDIPGYRCMALNLRPEDMVDVSFSVPVFSQPKNSSPQIGVAAATVAARDPIKRINGFVEVLFPTGARGWIAERMLRAWHPAEGTSASCIPVQLSNGRFGFDYPNS